MPGAAARPDGAPPAAPAPDSLAALYRDRGVAAWLLRLHGVFFAHGADLVDALGEARPAPGPGPEAYRTADGWARPGVGDCVASAGTILADLERLGWITRGAYAPTRQQQFFGIGGSWAQDRNGLTAYLPAYGWCPSQIASVRATVWAWAQGDQPRGPDGAQL